MDQLQQIQHGHALLDFSSRGIHCLRFANQRQTRCFVARVDFQAKRLEFAVVHTAVDKPDDHGHDPMHARPTAVQQQPGSFFGARHQRLALAVQHKYRHIDS